jgi:hypothetical protein
MDLKLVLGLLAVAYGVYTLYVRAASPEKLGKLEAMKEQWGERGGTIAHVVAYTVLPIAVGLVLVVTSLMESGAAPE